MLADFQTAMRHALNANGASDPLRATRIIQQALVGKFTGPSVSQKGGIKIRALSVEPPNPIEARSEAITSVGSGVSKRGLAQIILDLKARPKGYSRAPKHSPFIPAGAQFYERSFQNEAGQRNYKLYVPTHCPPRGLVVMLHGCTQTAEDFAVGTDMNTIAERENLLVAYPIQRRDANASVCWNWFLPKDQGRGRGEPEIIAGITRSLIDEFDLSGEYTMIAGLSAGGAMAMVMGATYPELYQSIGVHSGLPYKSASDIPSALSTMAGNQRFIDTRAGSFPRTIIFHGLDDQTVKSHNASNLWRQALGGQKLDEVQIEKFVSGSRIVRRQIRRDADQRSSAELWMIEGAGHCWSGGNTLGSYADPEGPNASEEMIRFLLRKPTNNKVGFFE